MRRLPQIRTVQASRDARAPRPLISMIEPARISRVAKLPHGAAKLAVQAMRARKTRRAIRDNARARTHMGLTMPFEFRSNDNEDPRELANRILGRQCRLVREGDTNGA